MDWSLALMLFVSLLVTYASLLLLLAVFLWFCGQPLHLHSVHKVLLLLIVLLVIAGLVLLDVQWQEEWLSLRLSLWATAPFLHIGAVAFITILTWPVADSFYHIRKRGANSTLIHTLSGHPCFSLLLPDSLHLHSAFWPQSLPTVLSPQLVPHSSQVTRL